MGRTAKRNYGPEVVQAYFDQHRLPAHYKAILDAFVAHGTYRAVAVFMGLKIGTVKSKLNRARNAVDKLVAEDTESALRTEERRADGP